MNDVTEFLSGYQSLLERETQLAEMPAELLQNFQFESCLVRSDTKELYVVRRIPDGYPGLLRISKNDAHEDAGAEAVILGTLNHPAIPRVLAYWQLPGRGFLVREYFDGRTLAQTVAENGVLPAKDVLAVAEKLAGILQYLHGQAPPVVHRDLKPQNIILAPDGSLKLIDFGIARSYQPGNMHDTVYLGTRPYAPPEQFGYAQTSPASDIYALGVVLLFLATGSTDRYQLEARVKNRRLRGLIERCIAFDPQARFSGADEVIAYLRRTAPRRLQLLAGIACGVAALVLVATLGYVLGRAKNPPALPSSTAGGSLPGGQADAPSLPQSGASLPDGSGSVSGGDSSTAPLPFGGGTAPLPGQLPFDGNFSGNSVNGGFAVGTEEIIYYSTGDGIWRMDPGSGAAEELCRLPNASHLQLYDDLLYCTTGRGIYSIDPTTGEAEMISDAWADKILMYEGKIYLADSLDGLNMKWMDPDGNGQEALGAEGVLSYANIVNGKVYFGYSPMGRILCTYDLAGDGSIVPFYEREVAWLSHYDNLLYFCDYSASGGIMCATLDGEEIVRLHDGGASYTNATPYGIFFADGVNGSVLIRMSFDGMSKTQLTSGGVDNICVAGGWVFYYSREDGGALWMVRIDGGDNQKAPM